MTGTYNEIRCPKCEASIFVYAEQAGDTISCPRCQNKILVPGSKHSGSSSSAADELINIDDDIPGTEPQGDLDTANSVDQPIKVESDPVELSSELQLAPETDESRSTIPDQHDSSQSDPEAKSDDDLGDLIDIPETESIDDQANPFEVDENADLVVDGVTPTDGQFPVTCNLCGSLLYARVSQVGTQIKCHDCHSMVVVHEPRVAPKPAEEFATPLDEEGGYTLKEPVDLKPIDTTFDITLGEINYDDDDFFDKRRQLAGPEHPEVSDEDNSTVAKAVSDSNEIFAIDEATLDEMVVENRKPTSDSTSVVDEYNLAPEPNDPSGPAFQTPVFTTGTNISNPVSLDKESEADHSNPKAKKADTRDIPAQVTPEPSDEKKAATDGLDYSAVFGNFPFWVRFAIKPLTDIQCLLRIAIATLVIGSCYMAILGGASFFNEETNQLEKFGGFALLSFGGLPLLVLLFFLGVMANSIIRMSMEEQTSLSEWPEFSITDWFSQFIYIGTSFWLAAFPGLILGSLLTLVTKNPVWLYSLIMISSLMLSPFILSSVAFNESPAALISAGVFQSVRPMRNRWIRFLIAAFCVGLSLALSVFILSLLVGGLSLLGFLIAAIQVSLLFIYWWILGDHVGNVVRWMIDQKES